jgi:hypothetical protein
MSKIYEVVDLEKQKRSKNQPVHDWQEIQNNFDEIMKRDLVICKRIRLEHNEKGIIEGILKFKRDGIIEIRTDEGEFINLDIKFCKILKPDETKKEVDLNKTFNLKIIKTMGKQDNPLSREQKEQIDELFKDGKKEMHSKCNDEKAIYYAKEKGLYAFATAKETGVSIKLANAYLKEKGYIGEKTNKRKKVLQKEKIKIPVKKPDNSPKTIINEDKFFATCESVRKEYLDNETILLSLKLTTSDSREITGNILISKALFEDIND